MSLEHAPARSSAAQDFSQRAGFTVDEFITLVVPMSRAHFYKEVAAGRIHIKKNGSRTIVPVGEGTRYVASLPAAQKPPA